MSIAKITFKSAVAHEYFLVEAKCRDAYSEKESSAWAGQCDSVRDRRNPAPLCFQALNSGPRHLISIPDDRGGTPKRFNRGATWVTR